MLYIFVGEVYQAERGEMILKVLEIFKPNKNVLMEKGYQAKRKCMYPDVPCIQTVLP